MPVSVSCTGCDAVYQVNESLIGKTIKCKACGTLMKVAAAAKAAKAAKAASRPLDDEDEAPRRPSRRPADDDDDYDDAPRKTKKKGPPVALLVGGLAAVLLVGGGVAGFLLFGGDNPDPPPVAVNNPPARGEANTAEDNPPPAEIAKKVAAKTKEVKEKTASEDAKAKELDAKAEEVKPKVERQAEEAKTVAAPPVESPMSSIGMSRQEYMFGRMNRLTLDRVKKASVMFRVEVDGGSAEGSGWFGMEPGIIFTNAHVIDMLSPTAKPPKKITLFLNAGTDEQREIPNARVKILAVDWDLDLAVLKVENEKDLPTPLDIRPSADLIQGQGLNTIGYPFGTGAGLSGKPPEVSVRPSTFTASRKDVLGRTRRIQIEGGVYTGNSGGPIVDAEGYVVGVVVEVQLDRLGGGQTQLGLGVPTEYVVGLAAGRVANIEYGVPYRDGGKVKIPVKAKCLDPFNRLKEVGLAAWVGDAPKKDDASPFRKESKDAPKMGPADSDLKEVTLTYDRKTKVASGEITMPEAAAGKAYWAQPFYSNLVIPKYYTPGTPVSTDGPPVDRVPANLTVRIKEGAVRSVTMSNSSSGLAELNEEESSANRPNLKTTLKVRETMLPADRNDTLSAARLRMQIEDFKLSAELAGRGLEIDQVLPKRIEEQLNELFKQVEAIGAINRMGEMYKYVLTLFTIPDPNTKSIIDQLGRQAVDALQATSIPIPNKEVKPGESWESIRDVRLTLFSARPAAGPRPGPGGPGGGQPAPPRVREYKYRDKVKFTYMGTRERGGKKEAVIQVEGELLQAPGEKATVTGEVKGLVLVELDTGLVTKADIKKTVDLDTSSEGKRKRITSNNHYTLTRGAAN